MNKWCTAPLYLWILWCCTNALLLLFCCTLGSKDYYYYYYYYKMSSEQVQQSHTHTWVVSCHLRTDCNITLQNRCLLLVLQLLLAQICGSSGDISTNINQMLLNLVQLVYIWYTCGPILKGISAWQFQATSMML